MNCFINN